MPSCGTTGLSRHHVHISVNVNTLVSCITHPSCGSLHCRGDPSTRLPTMSETVSRSYRPRLATHTILPYLMCSSSSCFVLPIHGPSFAPTCR